LPLSVLGSQAIVLSTGIDDDTFDLNFFITIVEATTSPITPITTLGVTSVKIKNAPELSIGSFGSPNVFEGSDDI
jgi:hypothetical protein